MDRRYYDTATLIAEFVGFGRAYELAAELRQAGQIPRVDEIGGEYCTVWVIEPRNVEDQA